MLAAIIPAGLNVLINPMVALNMDPKDYAIVGYYGSFSNFIFPMISFYAFAYYTKRYFEVNEDERQQLRAVIFKSLIYLSLGISIISILGIYLYKIIFNSDTQIPFFPYAFLSVFTIPITGIFTLKLIDYKLERKAIDYFKLSIGKSAIAISLTLLLVVWLKWGAFGKLTAIFISTFALFIYCLIDDYKLFKVDFDWAILKKMLLFSWPLIIGAMLNFFTNGYDRVYLERLGNPDELGFYVVAFQIVSYLGLIGTSISSTFQPDIAKAIVNRNWNTALKYMTLLVSSVTVVVIVFVFFAPFLVDVLTAGRYVLSTKYAQILAFYHISQIIYFMSVDVITFLGYTKILLFSKIIGAIFSIALFYFFINYWGFSGGAYAMVLSFFVLTLFNVAFMIPKRKAFLSEQVS